MHRANEEAIVLWNNEGSADVTFSLAAEDFKYRRETDQGALPRFAVLHVGEDALRWQRGAQVAGGQISVIDWFASLVESIGSNAAANAPANALVQFDIQGAQGHTAFLTLAEGLEARLTDGTHEMPDVTITAEDADWLALINGLVGLEEAFLGSKLKVSGDFNLALQMAEAISLAPPGTYRPEHWRLDVTYLDILTVNNN